jgi:hypothetical protein
VSNAIKTGRADREGKLAKSGMVSGSFRPVYVRFVARQNGVSTTDFGAFAGFANRRSELPLSIDAVPLPQTAGPRKVASPDPAETPAPVRMTIEGVAVAARLTKMARREKAAAPSRLSRS